jgi:phosphoribosyl 1,2-cyclic phosphate phosphodiesterase
MPANTFHTDSMHGSLHENTLQLTVLGSGTSMGVPTIGCRCPVCASNDPRDNRLRTSVLLSRNGQNVLIDTTPDFRTQALRTGIDQVEAVLLTHGHADHVMGFDDLRPLSVGRKQPMPVYGNKEAFEIVRRAFSYAFDGKPKLSTVPSVVLKEVDGPFELLGVKITPIPLEHGEMQVLGFRFGRGAYLTDFNAVPESSLALLQDLDELILDALRDTPHPMHQTVAQALALVERIKPKRAWFTHIAHDLGHAATNERLRKQGYSNVGLAYDGLKLEIAIEAPASPSERSEFVAARLDGLRVFTSAEAWREYYAPTGRGSVLAIGNFDGIHRGHQAILKEATERTAKSGAVTTALTFEPAPRKVLRPETAPKRLSTNEQRLEWFRVVGVEAAVVMPFTLGLSKLSPQEFVEKILVAQLCVRTVLVGENFRFGHKQAGDTQLLRELGKSHGFEVVTIPPVVAHGEVVSSTVIRREIADGEVTQAGRLLGRPFVLTGTIVTGTGTGSKFTFPTLNLHAEQELLPATGVYITRTLLDGETESRRSVTNIGVRPTFDGHTLTVETHLLNFSGQVSAKRMELRFWKRLRAERRFSGPDELRAQIAKDIASANRFFTLLRKFRILMLSD